MSLPQLLDNRPRPTWVSRVAAGALVLGLITYGYVVAHKGQGVHAPTVADQGPLPSQPHNLSGGLLSEPLTTVELPVANLSQQTPVWCWVTVAQQIIAASKGPQSTPQQCELVATADGVSADTCCAGYNQQCVHTGSLQQIQRLIQQYGGRTSSYAQPTDPLTLYKALKDGHAVVIALNMNGSGHVVVARGMTTVPANGGYEAMILLNDPMAQYTQPVPFDQIAPLWQEAIVIN